MQCPECKSNDVINQGGCHTCRNCGMSACPSG